MNFDWKLCLTLENVLIITLSYIITSHQIKGIRNDGCNVWFCCCDRKKLSQLEQAKISCGPSRCFIIANFFFRAIISVYFNFCSNVFGLSLQKPSLLRCMKKTRNRWKKEWASFVIKIILLFHKLCPDFFPNMNCLLINIQQKQYLFFCLWIFNVFIFILFLFICGK